MRAIFGSEVSAELAASWTLSAARASDDLNIVAAVEPTESTRALAGRGGASEASDFTPI